MNSKPFKERGQALILIALAMVGLVAIVGLAIDGSAVFADQRHAQNAADTAAMAAAYAKVNTLKEAESNSSISTSPTICASDSMSGASDVCVELVLDGLDRATSNGYTNSTDVTVKIYSPPATGYYQGNDDYVQVLITSTVNTTFMKVVGRNEFTHTVQAVALAKPRFDLADGAMIISYDPDPNCSVGGTGGYSVKVTGDAIVNLDGGGIFLNSDEVCGFTIPNCAKLKITNGGGINTVGADNINTTGCTYTPPLTKNYNQDPIVIPDEVYWPPEPKECKMTGYPAPTKLGEITVPGNPLPVEEWLIYPGYYETFPQATLVAKKSHIYMASGVYCIDPGGPSWNGDLSWSPVDAALLNGSTSSTPGDVNYNKYHAYNPSGVTLYIKGPGGFTINTKSPTYLDASSNPNGPNGDYQGYLIIQKGTSTVHPSCVINGGADIYLNGMIFAPYCNFTINGKAGETAAINAQLIGWDLTINGSNQINFNYDPSNQVKIKAKVGLMK